MAPGIQAQDDAKDRAKFRDGIPGGLL